MKTYHVAFAVTAVGRPCPSFARLTMRLPDTMTITFFTLAAWETESAEHLGVRDCVVISWQEIGTEEEGK